MTVAAGEDWDDVVAAAVAEELAGLECLSGIPGRTGATPIQNVGAYGHEVAEVITTVRVFDRLTDPDSPYPERGVPVLLPLQPFQGGGAWPVRGAGVTFRPGHGIRSPCR